MWPYLIHDSSCGCVTCTPSTNLCYAGPNLPNTGIQNNDTLSLALQKIDAAIGALIPTTTTTTTTLAPISFGISTLEGSGCTPIVLNAVDNTAYHTGTGVYPILGDFVYSDVNKTTFYPDNTTSGEAYTLGNSDIIRIFEGAVASIMCK